ncbi:hypothetical protein BKA70DRAFT_568958 [Coprinopsis sp. MPI-PUGE-AT-0042]|nr:hypothetical protein BKA70DRAFT_568958 [Coprinopsis sp. MPI-PUGE-AT-0042]
MTAPTRNELKAAAQSFCEAFAEKKDPDTILTLFSSKEPISAIEYGEKDLAPFLGRRFEGEKGVRNYLGLVSSLLAFDEMSFSEYVVDSEERKVAVKGRCVFEWKETRESWDETFAYVLDFDDEAKVVRYQIWADSGAAYLARSASLQRLRKNPNNVV